MTIDLAIVVVYMVSDGNEPLLDLHLARIDRHTTVPYAIYGSATRLPSSCRRRLEEHSRVRLQEFPPTPLRGAEEHTYYLDRLVGRAIAGGASHIAILHVDSFPIRDGWVEALSGRLSDSCVFVTMEAVNTACLLFTRAFYLAHRPPFLLSEAEEQSPGYAAFVRETGLHLHHSGTGFAFTAHQEGLSWSTMRQSSRGGPTDAAVYEDLVFHLKGALSLAHLVQQARRSSEVPPRQVPGVLSTLGSSRFEGFLRGARAVIPPRFRRQLRARLGGPIGSLVDEPRLRWHTQTRDRLLEDSDAFIEQLRGDQRG
jgi:hypothetical protein